MARDGLLPGWAAKIHPRYQTPYITTILTGVAVAAFSSVTNINEVVELTNIGTLFAFVLVSAGILILRYTDPKRARPFRTPLVPLVPLLSIGSCFMLMVQLPGRTWWRFVIWLAVGLVLYFVLRLQAQPAANQRTVTRTEILMTYYGAADLARSFRVVRKNTLAAAADIPEDQYDFRPAPGCRSVREILAHIAVSSTGNFQGHAVRKVTTFIGVDFPALIRERQEREQRLASASKDELIALLRDDGEQWGAYLDSVTEDELGVIIPFPEPAVPRTKSRFEMFLSAKEHEMHHRAQLMVFQRLLGIVPHLTRERQARMQAPPAR